ncbi:hypothetical protein CERSUDRAFT_75983 [Gelatoporia subvermispora B]|uniref:Uncharacterized protein n=1 Tax=Ceriporiopsis subvermispora (strain B) TaxID=914234 RepID=M2QQL1_CERS8|nr:hypothetical protein CERSUDRAFT_75983 [Gelatoporia subvermispora B]
MNSEHVFLCTTAGIPLCPNVQFENGVGDAEGHNMDNDSECGHESCTKKYRGRKCKGKLFEETILRIEQNKAAVDSNVEAKNNQDTNITLEDGKARQSHIDPISADTEGWAMMKGYISWQRTEGTP